MCPQRATAFADLTLKAHLASSKHQPNVILEKALSTERALSVAYARKCVLSILTHWPQVSTTAPIALTYGTVT